jgi:hypothetical protein
VQQEEIHMLGREATEYSLVEIVRDPGLWIYEANELTADGHYYLYRYDAARQVFSRATVPAGAAAIHFYDLKSYEKVPIDGWQHLERIASPSFRPRLVTARKSAAV